MLYDYDKALKEFQERRDRAKRISNLIEHLKEKRRNDEEKEYYDSLIKIAKGIKCCQEIIDRYLPQFFNESIVEATNNLKKNKFYWRGRIKVRVNNESYGWYNIYEVTHFSNESILDIKVDINASVRYVEYFIMRIYNNLAIIGSMESKHFDGTYPFYMSSIEKFPKFLEMAYQLLESEIFRIEHNDPSLRTTIDQVNNYKFDDDNTPAIDAIIPSYDQVIDRKR